MGGFSPAFAFLGFYVSPSAGEVTTEDAAVTDATASDAIVTVCTATDAPVTTCTASDELVSS